MRKGVIYLAVFCALSLGSTSIRAEFVCTKSLSLTYGERVAQEVHKRYGELRTVRSKFNQFSYLAALDVSESSSGDVWFMKPGHIRFKYTKPEPQEFLIKDRTFWYYQPLDRQVRIQELDEVLISELPVAFLMGIGNLTEDFELQSACQAGEHVILTLSPKVQEGDGDLQSFKLLIDVKSYHPVGAEVEHLGGNRTTIELLDRQVNPKVEKAAFELDLPRDTDIIDDRKRDE